MNVYAERLGMLREMMSANGWDAVLISSSDPHNSEYTASRWKQIEWLSGFTGEAGEMVVTQNHSGLWTDSRFFIQAARQLVGSGTELHKSMVSGTETVPEWLAGKARVVAVDGLCHTEAYVDELVNTVRSKGAECRTVNVPDMISGIWTDRPAIPEMPVITLSEETVGKSRYDKLTDLRKFLLLNDCDATVITALDEIAWLLNIRGEDIEYNPFVISYLFVSQSETIWFVKKTMIMTMILIMIL